MKKINIILIFIAAVLTVFFSCKKESSDEITEPEQQQEPIPAERQFESEFDSLLYMIRDMPCDAVESEYQIDESLYNEEYSKVQKLDNDQKKQISSFGDSLYAVYFGKSLKKSLPYDVIENPEDIYIVDENRNYSNGKYIVKTESNTVVRPTWGPTLFNQWVSTVAVLNADKSVDVYIYPTAGYFKNGGYLFMKLGSVNSGKSYNNECVHFKEGAKYVYFHINNFDEFADGDPSWQESRKYRNCLAIESIFPLTDFGYVNIFPLLLSDNGSRYYTHPIHIKTSEYYNKSFKVPSFDGHIHNNHPDYGKVYGTIDGVRVICNGPGNHNCDDCAFQTYQCSELTTRYANLVLGKNTTKKNAKDFYDYNTEYLDRWVAGGDKYIPQAPQESDLLVLTSTSKDDIYGHIVVVSRVDYAKKELYYSQQNAMGGDPIMKKTTFHEKDGRYKIDWGGGFFDYILRPKLGNLTYASTIDKEYKDVYDTPYRELELDYDLSGSKTVAYGEDLSLSINANYNCDIYLNIDGEKSKYTGKSKLNIELPTSKPGTHTVKFYGVLDDEEGETYQFTYIVNEPKTPTLSVSLSSTSVQENETVKITVSTDMDCNIKYTVNGNTYTYYNPTTLPTSTAGSYTVKVTATAKDGGKTATATKSYTVTQKPEPKTPIINVTLSATTVKIGETVKLTVSTDIECDIKYTIGGSTKSYSSTTSLPTSTAGTYTVKVVATAKDGGKTATENRTYTVNEPKTPTLSATLSSTSVQENETVKLTVSTDMDCDIKYTVNGNTYTYYNPTTLPTSTAGSYTVKVTATAKDGGKTATATKSYTVTKKPEPKTPVINVTLSATTVKIGETVKLTVSTDIDCDIKYTIGSSTKSYSSSTYLPTSTAGTYTVKVTATAKDGGKTATESKTYTVNEPKTPTLSATLSSTSVQENETVKLTVSTDMDCDIKYTVNGNTYTYYNPTTLPTSTAGSYTVKVTATAKDGGKTAQATKSYTVTQKPEPKTPVVSASLSATSVEEGGNVRLTVNTDMDCDIKYTINGNTYTYYNSIYLPTNTAGNYTVKVTATARDGGKTATDTKYYTVNKKYEPIVVNLRLGNPPAVVYKGDNAKVYFSTGGIPCKIEYQYGTLQKQTYSNNATEGYVPLFTTNGASDVELTVYATPLEDSQNTYSKSITYDVTYPFQVNFTEPSGNSFEVGELKYFTVHSPYHLVDASFKYYQRSDLNEYEDDFTKYYHTLYTDEPGHYKLTIKVTSRENSNDYETYTYEYDVEEEDVEPEITFSKSTNKYIDVDDYYTLTIYTDKMCKIKVYDDDEELIKSKSDTDNLTITVPTSYKVGKHYIYVKAISESGLETEKSWKYTLEEIKIPDVTGSKIFDINYNSKNVELYPNTDAEFSVYYRGNGIFRVSKNTGYFQSGGIFFIVDAGSVENGWPISEYGMEDYVNKDGDAYYDLQIPKKRNIDYYLIEIHKVSYGYTGYYIGPFTY